MRRVMWRLFSVRSGPVFELADYFSPACSVLARFFDLVSSFLDFGSDYDYDYDAR